MKRWTILVALIAVLLVPLAPTFSAETPLKTINVSVPAVSLLQAPLFVAMDAGAFKKYGMDVRYVLTGARTIQALIGGSVQFAQGVSSRTVPSAVLGGADAILIANFVDKFLFTMHSAPEINSMQDLRGKVVGVSGIGGSTDFAMRALGVVTVKCSPALPDVPTIAENPVPGYDAGVWNLRAGRHAARYRNPNLPVQDLTIAHVGPARRTFPHGNLAHQTQRNALKGRAHGASEQKTQRNRSRRTPRPP